MTQFKSFSQIIGQERAVAFLKEVIASEKIPHAYLFTGIQGIGKTTTALALAQAVNCLEITNREGCGKCLPCRQLVSGNFPDLVFFEPDGRNIKIEQIRGLNRSLNYKPVSGRYRVCIIHQAEKMTEEAANSFLKTLEEPPPGNILVLKATEPLDLLPTIVSRCQKVPFRPLSVQMIERWLRTEMGMDEESSRVLARLSEGSLENAIQHSDDDLIEKRLESLTRLIQLPRLSSEETLQMAVEYSTKTKKKSAKNSGGSEFSLFELLGIWKTWYRDLILMKMKDPVPFIKELHEF